MTKDCPVVWWSSSNLYIVIKVKKIFDADSEHNEIYCTLWLHQQRSKPPEFLVRSPTRTEMSRDEERPY